MTSRESLLNLGFIYFILALSKFCQAYYGHINPRVTSGTCSKNLNAHTNLLVIYAGKWCIRGFTWFQDRFRAAAPWRREASEPRTPSTDQLVSVLQGVNAVGSDPPAACMPLLFATPPLWTTGMTSSSRRYDVPLRLVALHRP